jgi:hypothetical protein
MKLSYLILAHKHPGQFHRLVNRLNSENVYFFVHVDKSTDDTPFKEPFLNTQNIFFLEGNKRMVTPWSDIAICKVTLNLLNEANKKFNSNNYCVLLSGQDYPIKSNDYIYNFYKSNYGQNFIAINDITAIWPRWQDRFERYNFHLPNQRVNKGIYPIRDKRFFNIRNFKNAFFLIRNVGPKTSISTMLKTKREHPDYLIPKGGGTWWALPVETAIDIINYLKKHPDLINYHSYTHVPDETIFSSIVNDLRENNQIQETTTYTNWTKENADSPLTFKKNDLQELLDAGDSYLFARKFDMDQDIDILKQLDGYIGVTTTRETSSN